MAGVCQCPRGCEGGCVEGWEKSGSMGHFLVTSYQKTRNKHKHVKGKATTELDRCRAMLTEGGLSVKGRQVCDICNQSSK